MITETLETVNVDEIKVVDRARKDLGNVEELAKSIRDLGLLQPVVITEENVLVAGERRLAACKLLGWKQIKARKVRFEDYLQQLKAERDENVCRKGFTFSEMVELGKKIEAVERERAKERMKDPLQNFAEGEAGLTRDKVAEQVGFGSGETYRKAKFVADHADPEIIQKLNEEKISINRAYQETKAKLEAVEKVAEAERKRADELEKQLAELQNRNLNSEEDMEKLRETIEQLQAELAALKNRKPEVIEKIVPKTIEKVVEKVVFKPDPAVEAELETVKNEIERFQAEAEQWKKEKAAFEAIVAQLKKNQSSGKAALQKDHSEMRQVLERASSLSRELGGVVDRLVKNHGETLVSLAGSGADESGDLREIADRTVESMAYTMFRLSLEFLADRMAGLFDLLEEKPRFAVLKGGKFGAEKA